MSYCPKCHREFEIDNVICPDCEVDLISDVPAEIPEEYSDEEWVELHTFPGAMYAQMAVELLHRDGIPAYSKASFLGSAYGVGGGGYIGDDAQVYVLEPDVERALTTIEPIVDDIPEPNFGGDEEE